MDTEINELLTLIAKKHFRVETLETRNRDSLDFHDVSVASIKSALRAAYEAGQAVALKPRFVDSLLAIEAATRPHKGK